MHRSKKFGTNSTSSKHSLRKNASEKSQLFSCASKKDESLRATDKGFRQSDLLENKDTLVCGEMLLTQSTWQLNFRCTFCGEVMASWDNFLRHTLKSHMAIPDEESETLVLETRKRMNLEQRKHGGTLEQSNDAIVNIKEEENEQDDEEFKEEIKYQNDSIQLDQIEEVLIVSGSDDDDQMEEEDVQPINYSGATCELSEAAMKQRSLNMRLMTPQKIARKDSLPKFRSVGSVSINSVQKDEDSNSLSSASSFCSNDDDENYSSNEVEHEIEVLNNERPNSAAGLEIEFLSSEDEANRCSITKCVSLTPRSKTETLKPFKYPTILKYDQNLDNNAAARQSCNLCSARYNTLAEMRSHTKNEHGNVLEKERPYACDMCDARFAEASNAKVHRNRHLGIKPYKCKECEKNFTSSTELKIHIRSHTGEKPYICDECGQAFSSSSHKTAHLRRHRNERTYMCSECGKGFFDNKILRDHKITHTTERPFGCEQCNAKFKRYKALVQHEKLHSNVKQYGCSLCDKEFAQNAGLHAHLRKHHSAHNESKL